MEINVQDVFNKVIDMGYYPDTPFMCVALTKAFGNEKLSCHELEVANIEISTYLGEYSTLYSYITGKEVSTSALRVWSSKEGVEIYRNWENRQGRKNLFTTTRFTATLEK